MSQHHRMLYANRTGRWGGYTQTWGMESEILAEPVLEELEGGRATKYNESVIIRTRLR
jgi:hypothetical protein